MEKAKVTLIGPLSLAVGRFRFIKGQPVLVTDKQLLEYVAINPNFKVEAVAAPVAPTATAKATPKAATTATAPVQKAGATTTTAPATPKRLSRKVIKDGAVEHETD